MDFVSTSYTRAVLELLDRIARPLPVLAEPVVAIPSAPIVEVASVMA